MRNGDLAIVVDDLSGPAVVAFLDDHVRQMRAISPEGSSHALDLDGLRPPDVTVWSVLDGDDVVGCGALKVLGGGEGELKSMRTAPERARSGIASALLRHILADAAARGLTRVSLETGSTEFFLPARRLYERFGFTYCDPFADYVPDPHSVFMTRKV
ncbi:GNAT family N-acetyltransferase [Prauserella rugosa]|uniref:Putative acetyltransferase n=1 Tax=Prauserella rugosa TaxID=43354 RepID=A0A660C6J6_9PSEU|nr:GNAT family N-acetyltransferase [Prauserella rugosa]KMS84286.1 GCN5 family acetyltransferase [Streptomyces regensis]TWH19112.1 putative acetyltransferase [Prauserella rugosa]